MQGLTQRKVHGLKLLQRLGVGAAAEVIERVLQRQRLLAQVDATYEPYGTGCNGTGTGLGGRNVLPAAMATSFGGSDNSIPFTWSPVRYQQVFLGSDLPSAFTMAGLELRQNERGPVAHGVTVDLEIMVGYTTRTPTTMSTTFATNFDSGTPVVVSDPPVSGRPVSVPTSGAVSTGSVSATSIGVVSSATSIRVSSALASVVVVSALVQGTTLEWVAERLGLVDPRPEVHAAPLEVDAFGNLELVEFDVAGDHAIDGAFVRELGLPRSALIALVARGKDTIPPRGSTVIEAGDRLFVLVPRSDRPELEDVFTRWRQRV